jgi:hypothetical protein
VCADAGGRPGGAARRGRRVWLEALAVRDRQRRRLLLGSRHQRPAGAFIFSKLCTLRCFACVVAAALSPTRRAPTHPNLTRASSHRPLQTRVTAPSAICTRPPAWPRCLPELPRAPRCWRPRSRGAAAAALVEAAAVAAAAPRGDTLLCPRMRCRPAWRCRMQCPSRQSPRGSGLDAHPSLGTVPVNDER